MSQPQMRTAHRPGRRAVLGALAATAGSAALAACGSGAGADDGTITWATGNDPVSIAYWKAAATEWEKENPGHRIQFTLIPNTALDAWLVTRTVAGTAPDIVNLGVAAIGRYAGNGTAVDIAEHVPQGFVDGYSPAMAALIAKQDAVFGVPQDTSCMALYYRRDIMDQIGVTVPDRLEDAWTWTEVRAVAEETAKATKAYAMSWGFINANSGNRWLPAAYCHGAAPFGDDGRTPTADTPEMVEALEWTRLLYEDGLISRSNTIKASQADTATGLFVSGQVGLMVHEAKFADLQKGLDDDQWGLTYLFRDVDQFTTNSGSVNVVTSSSRYPAAAASFLTFVSDRQHTIERIRKVGTISPHRGVSVEDVAYEVRPDLMATFVEQFTVVAAAAARDMAGPDYQTVRELLADTLDPLFTGQASARRTAHDMNEALRNVQH